MKDTTVQAFESLEADLDRALAAPEIQDAMARQRAIARRIAIEEGDPTRDMDEVEALDYADRCR